MSCVAICCRSLFLLRFNIAELVSFTRNSDVPHLLELFNNFVFYLSKQKCFLVSLSSFLFMYSLFFLLTQQANLPASSFLIIIANFSYLSPHFFLLISFTADLRNLGRNFPFLIFWTHNPQISRSSEVRARQMDGLSFPSRFQILKPQFLFYCSFLTSKFRNFEVNQASDSIRKTVIFRIIAVIMLRDGTSLNRDL